MPGLSRRIAASLVVGQLVLAPSLQAAGVVARSTRAGASPAPLAAFAPSGEVPAALLLTSPTPLDLAAPAPALANEPLSPAPLERVVEAAPGEPLPMAASASSASPEPGQNGGASAAARELASVREAAAPAMAASADAGSAPGDLHRSGRTLEAALTGAGAPASAGEPAPPAETGPWGPVPTSLARSRAPAPVLRRAAVPIGAAAAAAILPHGVWAQLWPAALVLAGAALLLLVEAWTGGGLMRWAHQAATRPSLDRALRQDAAGLFDFPAGREEPDRAEVSAFVGRWLDANGAGRKELAEEALSDPALWREKLVAAQLAGGEEALDAIKRSPRAGLEPVSAVLKTVLAKRGTSALLERREVLRRLARLSPEADAPAPRRRLPLWAAATAASAAFAFLGWTGYHALEHGRSQDAAQRDAREIFYGPESFIFADDYRDPRIPGEVLPLLRRWQSLTDDDAPALSRAVETLRASPDPRSDNVLEAVFARADLLPLTPESERLLLSALIEREHEGIWRHMRRALEERRATEAEVERLLLMMELSQGAGDRTLQNVFYFTKARAPRVKQAAAKTIRDWLDDPAKGDRYARIEALLERYESDDALVLEAERCLLGFLGRPGTPPPASEAAGKAEKVLARVLEIAAKSDERRPRAFRAVRAGEEDARLIPPRVLGVLALLKEELEKAPPSPGLQWAARRQVDMAAAGLVEEARRILPDRSEDLRRRRVLPYAGQVRASGYARSHVRALHEILEGPAPEEPDPAKEAARREYVHRALKATERMLALADAAGMAQDLTTGQQAAEDVAGVLREPIRIFGDGSLEIELAARKLRNLPEYGPAELAGLRAVLERKYAEGKAPKFVPFLMFGRWSGHEPMLAWQYRNLADAIEDLYAIQLRWYPESPAQGALPPGVVMRRLKDADPKVRAEAERELRSRFPYDLGGMNRLWVAAMRQSSDPELSLWVGRYVLEQASRPGAPDIDAAVKELGTPPVLWAFGGAALDRVRSDDPALLWVELARSWEAAEKAPGGVPPGLAGLARRSLPWTLDSYINEAESLFPDLRDRLVQEGVVLQWDFNSGSVQRESYRRIHFRLVREAVRAEAAAAAKAGPLSPEQRRMEGLAGGYVDALLRVAELSGMPAGDSIEERAADWLNPVVKETAFLLGYGGDGFLNVLRARGLAPTGVAMQRLRAEDFQSRYSKAEADRLLALLVEVRSSGLGWRPTGGRMPLLAWQRQRLDAAIRRVEEIRARYP